MAVRVPAGTAAAGRGSAQRRHGLPAEVAVQAPNRKVRAQGHCAPTPADALTTRSTALQAEPKLSTFSWATMAVMSMGPAAGGCGCVRLARRFAASSGAAGGASGAGGGGGGAGGQGFCAANCWAMRVCCCLKAAAAAAMGSTPGVAPAAGVARGSFAGGPPVSLAAALSERLLLGSACRCPGTALVRRSPAAALQAGLGPATPRGGSSRAWA